MFQDSTNILDVGFWNSGSDMNDDRDDHGKNQDDSDSSCVDMKI